MTPQEQQSIIQLCLLAALADGGRDARERAELERIVQTFPYASDLDLRRLEEEVRERTPALAEIAANLSPAARQPAFELAVCVCNADGGGECGGGRVSRRPAPGARPRRRPRGSIRTRGHGSHYHRPDSGGSCPPGT